MPSHHPAGLTGKPASLLLDEHAQHGPSTNIAVNHNFQQLIRASVDAAMPLNTLQIQSEQMSSLAE